MVGDGIFFASYEDSHLERPFYEACEVEWWAMESSSQAMKIHILNDHSTKLAK
jgi:hypothetical protein